MTSPDPTYYRTSYDINTLDERDIDVLFITDEPADPLDKSGAYTARASDAEMAEWSQAYTDLKREVERVGLDLDAARAAWEHACGVAEAKYQDAWEAYRPVQQAIQDRHNEVEQIRIEAARQRDREERAAGQAAQAAEDAELGPSTWVIHHDTYSGRERSNTREMFVPTVHVAGCSITKGREASTPERAWRFARAAEVESAITTGGELAAAGKPTGERVPVRMCGRCKPEDSLRAAGLGAVYDAWRTETESLQPPRYSDKILIGKLGLKGEWCNWRTGTSGYSLGVDVSYRDAGLIQPFETLVGWWDGKTRLMTAHAPEKLKRLEEILPDQGFAVRRISSPLAPDGGGHDRWYVAVRRMTAGEIRQHKEATAPQRSNRAIRGSR